MHTTVINRVWTKDDKLLMLFSAWAALQLVLDTVFAFHTTAQAVGLARLECNHRVVVEASLHVKKKLGCLELMRM